MADYRLHSFALSGNSYKVALFLELAGADWEPIFVDYLGGETHTDRYRTEVNELGEAPVLEHAGLRLSQSGVILDYLAKTTGKFGPRSEQEAREIWRWVLFDNHKFTGYYATLRFMVGVKKVEEDAVTSFLRERALGAYRIVDKHLRGQDFIVGDRPTIADFSLAGYVFMPEPTGIDRSQFSGIEAWKARLMALPGWRHPYDILPGPTSLSQ
ncbi:glutathione S-transferase [Devosia insulae DS-56]|uniref:Glutathione S-transferase n=1 Tax=Devosia insulae DS-56 TaxID=1116389 RepID=A0A1E5XQZ9_9HYPH|nr:glutathione S-transferase [Devosia insulae]OEO31020.1 glutathione S-transferase [Devosia insulae DS-56]